MTGTEVKPVHLLMLSMANYCGEPSSSPKGGSATSVPGNVTCIDCLEQMKADYTQHGSLDD